MKEAEREQISLNALLKQITQAHLGAREEEDLFDSYSRLGEELGESNLEYAWTAQREAFDHHAG